MNVHKVVMDACNGQFFYNGCSGNWYVFVGQSINHEVGGGWGVDRNPTGSAKKNTLSVA